jgi:ubiquinone/menaquinone biosynthesis C-methylase UbiE
VSAIRAVFAAAAGAYDRGNPLLLMERPETEALIGDVRGRRVLDLGAGTGHYAGWARARGARVAVALDVTPEMLAHAPRPAVVADAARLPFGPGCFDVVVGALVMSFVRDRGRLLREASRVLGPGGVLVLSDMHEIASELGWERSFRGPNGERLVIDAVPPRVEAMRKALGEAGFALEDVREPRIDDRLAQAFRRAGRSDFETLRGLPVLQLYRASRGGS